MDGPIGGLPSINPPPPAALMSGLPEEEEAEGEAGMGKRAKSPILLVAVRIGCHQPILHALGTQPTVLQPF